MPQLNSNIWFGSEESYFALLHAQERLAAVLALGQDALKASIISAGGGGDDPFGMPPLWQKAGSVAVVDITGSLVNGNAGFLRLFGATGYGDIQDALAEIAQDPDIKSVLLNIDSGGGQVDGLADAGDAIQALDKTKPVMTYASGTMGSAAYWLGASARQVSAAPTSQVGSVGTLIISMERSQQLKANGITPTVVRFGKFKALNNPLEPLSEEGKAELQTLADGAGKIFVNYVAARRGMSAEDFQATAGEGRVFLGQQAVKVGLVDAVSNKAKALASAKSLDKSSTQPQNSRNSGKAFKMKLSKKTILAIAAGTALDALGLAEPEANLEGVKLEGEALVAAEAEAKEVLAAVTTRVDAATTEAAKPVAALTAEVVELKTKVTAAEAAAEAATGKVTLAEEAANGFKAKMDVATEMAASYATIVKHSLSVMSVALGGAADVGASLTGKELLAEHDRLAESFKKKFPTGGVAAVMGLPKPVAKASGASPMFRSLVKSATAK